MDTKRDHAPDLNDLDRRKFLRLAAMAGLSTGFGASLSGSALSALASDLITLPFANGDRRMAAFPQKRELILLRTRPPLLETPMAIFDQGAFTPNDAFYVRWHLPIVPTDINVASFRVRIHGHVRQPIELTLKQILHGFDPVEIAAVNQCSGNSRGFFAPRVAGGEWGNGAMGNARWTGVRLKDLLDRAGVLPGAVQVRFNGADGPEVPETPDFMKSLAIDHARDGEVMVAYGMNGGELPVLNGFPIRLVVPGWFATYWVKMLNDIEVLDHPDDNFWMKSAYLVPDNPAGNLKPGETGVKMVPISRLLPRSFITNLQAGATVHAGRPVALRGIAFGGDTGVAQVMVSADGGAQWHPARLGRDYGKYSFRQWASAFTPAAPGPCVLMVKTINSNGLSQPLEPNWNPGGFMRNVIERTPVKVI